jgi:hypothetical protein
MVHKKEEIIIGLCDLLNEISGERLLAWRVQSCHQLILRFLFDVSCIDGKI